MGKRITEQDIFQGDIFANARKSASEYIKMLNALQGELKEMLAINKKILQASAKDLKNTEQLKKRAGAIKTVTEASKQLEVVDREKVKTQRELSKLDADNERLKQQKNKTLIQERKEEERLAKIKAKNLKLAKQEGQAYSKQSKRLNTLRNKYKNLAVQNKQNTKEGKRLLKTIQKLDGKLKRVDRSVGQSQRNVGNYSSAWGKLGMRLKSVASAFGLMGGIMGAVSLVKNSFRVITNFDSAIANLGAISGATDKDLKKLTDNAKALGETTKFTASEVAGLSLELAKLGFTTPEILASTESILALASATGTELADASFIAGSTLRAFNLEASEMDRVASVLGVATTKSALNMEYLGTAMSKVAPVSSALGFSIEDTTSLLGVLANAGFDASSSATATRNILLNLADSSGDLATALGRPIKNLDELAPAFAELEAKGIDVATALELTDKRSVSAFKTFLNNTDTLIGLRDSITDVNAELQEMSDKQLDTIDGQLALLNSKWQGMILGASESAGVVESLKNGIKFLTDNLNTIITVLVKAIKYLIIFKTTQFAVTLAMKIGRGVSIAYRISMVAMSRGIGSATKMMKGFNTTMKANPIGLIISLLTTAIALLWDYADATDEAAESVDRLSKAYENMKKEQSKYFEQQDFEQDKTIALIDLEIAKAKSRGATQKELHNLNIKRLKAEQQANSRKSWVATDELEKMQKLRNEAQTTLDKDVKSLSFYKKLEDNQNIKFYTTRVASSQLTLDNANAEVEAQKKLLNDLENQGQILKINEETSKTNLKIKKKSSKASTKTKTVAKIINIYEKERNKIMLERVKIMEEIRKEEVNYDIQNMEQKIEAELKAREDEATSIEFIKAGNEVDLTLYHELLAKKQELQNKQVRETTEFAITQKEKEQERFLLFLKKSVDDKKLTQDEANVLILESEKILVAEIDLLRIQENAQYKDFQDQKVNATKEANEQILESTESTQTKMSDTDKAILQKRLNAFKGFTTEVIKQIDRRTDAQIKAIDKEISESEKREDELRQLAIKGTTTAEQSLASEQKRQAELERQKDELEKKKMRRQAILSGLDLLSQKLEQNDGDAVTSTIRDITKLVAIIGSLPAFAEGSEYVHDSNAPKGKDKILARIDEGERIMTKQQNKKIGGLSNEQLTTLAMDYNSGVFEDVNWIKPQMKKLSEPFQSTSMILDKFDELQKTIENKPMLTEVRWDEVSQMIIEKVETKQRIDNKHQSTKGIF